MELCQSLESKQQDCRNTSELASLSKKTNIDNRSCAVDSPGFLSTQILEITLQTSNRLRSSEDFHAEAQVEPEADLDYLTSTLVSGLKCFGLSISPTRILFSLKMCQGLWIWVLEQQLEDSKWQATTATIRSSYQQLCSAHRNNATGSWLLPTPMGHARAKNSYSAPGQDRLERKLREFGIVPKGEISTPEFREWMQALPPGWTDIIEADGGKITNHPQELAPHQEVSNIEESEYKQLEIVVRPNKALLHGEELLTSQEFHCLNNFDSGKNNVSDRQDIKFGQSDVEIADILSWAEVSVASSAKIGVELALSIPMPNSIPTRKSASLHLFQDERDRWLSLLEQVAPNKTQPEQMTALLEWIERHDLERTVESESAAQQVETKAWEKITALTEVLTRLVGHFEQQVAANSPGTDIEKSPHNTTRSTVSTAAKLSSKGQRSHQTEAEATDSTKSHNRHQSHPTRSMKADKRVNQAINQIIKHNSTPDLPHNQKWAITLSVLKAATQSSQAVINRVLVTRQQEIDQHHQEHELGAYHNSLHRKTGAKITSIVC